MGRCVDIQQQCDAINILLLSYAGQINGERCCCIRRHPPLCTVVVCAHTYSECHSRHMPAH